jgi:flagellin
VTQGDEATNAVTDPDQASGGLDNDNYFVTRSAKLATVSNVDLRSAKGAGRAINVIDGAIERISSMRAELGAIENRLEHTVSNLMNIAENTAAAKSRLNDADFSIESANLAKSQVLQQAGTAMLAQANARSQLVLQLLQ